MPKRKRPEEKPEKQFKRFLETAKGIEADETGKKAERAFSDLAKAKIRKQKPSTER